MARKFKKGDFVRVSQERADAFTGLRNYHGIVFRVVGENHDYDGHWKTWTNQKLIRSHPYWTYVERYPDPKGRAAVLGGVSGTGPIPGERVESEATNNQTERRQHMKAELTPAQKVERAKVQLVLMQPFWASLALRLDFKAVPDEFFLAHGTMPTMATDGKMVYYSETFVEQTPLKQLQAVIAEEVGHVAFGHTTRRDWRHPLLWNLGADAVLHPILKEAQFEVPEFAFYDKECEDKSAEQAYAILEKRWPPPPQGQQGNGGKGKGDGKGKPGGKGDQPPEPGCGQVIDHGGSSAERSAHEQEWTVALEQAAQMAKAAGNLPSSLERLVGEIKKPKIDWVAVLRRFFEQTLPHDYAWYPVARRYAASGIYLPSVVKEGYGEIVICTDTSGSIDLEMLRQFMSEINCIVSEIKPSVVYSVYCDTQIGKVDVFREGDVIDLSAVGGGGTDFAPVFRWCKKEGITPKCLIYLTDLQGPCDVEEPDFPVLWVTQDENLTGKFGETLRMPLGGD